MLEPMPAPIQAPQRPPGHPQSCPGQLGLAAQRQEGETAPYEARATVLLALKAEIERLKKRHSQLGCRAWVNNRRLTFRFEDGHAVDVDYLDYH